MANLLKACRTTLDFRDHKTGLRIYEWWLEGQGIRNKACLTCARTTSSSLDIFHKWRMEDVIRQVPGLFYLASKKKQQGSRTE